MVMRLYTLLLFILFSLTVSTDIEAKSKKDKGVYIFTCGESLNDSTSYVSGIFFFPELKENKKTHYLEQSPVFSEQFRHYLQNTFNDHFACVTFSNTKKAKLEKQLLKLRRHHEKRIKGNLPSKLVDIPADNFKLTYTSPTE